MFDSSSAYSSDDELDRIKPVPSNDGLESSSSGEVPDDIDALKEENARLRSRVEELVAEVNELTERTKMAEDDARMYKARIDALLLEKKVASYSSYSKSSGSPFLDPEPLDLTPGSPEAALIDQFPGLNQEIRVSLTKNDPDNPTLPCGPTISFENLNGLCNIFMMKKMNAVELNLRSWFSFFHTPLFLCIIWCIARGSLC